MCASTHGVILRTIIIMMGLGAFLKEKLDHSDRVTSIAFPFLLTVLSSSPELFALRRNQIRNLGMFGNV